MKYLLSVIILFTGVFTAGFAQRSVVYPAPAGAELNDDFTVGVRQTEIGGGIPKVFLTTKAPAFGVASPALIAGVLLTQYLRWA
jgi:hypothetical protein